jgi:two-component system phosphate regulon response regulator PhoB
MDKPTVLVVDDEPKIRAIVRHNLQADGFTVTEQADGPGTLRAALDASPDLIVLDLMKRPCVSGLHRPFQQPPI